MVVKCKCVKLGIKGRDVFKDLRQEFSKVLLFTLFPRSYTLTSGTKMTTKCVGVDQSTSSCPGRQGPIRELDLTKAICLVDNRSIACKQSKGYKNKVGCKEKRTTLQNRLSYPEYIGVTGR